MSETLREVGDRDPLFEKGRNLSDGEQRLLLPFKERVIPGLDQVTTVPFIDEVTKLRMYRDYFMDLYPPGQPVDPQVFNDYSPFGRSIEIAEGYFNWLSPTLRNDGFLEQFLRWVEFNIRSGHPLSGTMQDLNLAVAAGLSMVIHAFYLRLGEGYVDWLGNLNLEDLIPCFTETKLTPSIKITFIDRLKTPHQIDNWQIHLKPIIYQFVSRFTPNFGEAAFEDGARVMYHVTRTNWPKYPIPVLTPEEVKS